MQGLSPIHYHDYRGNELPPCCEVMVVSCCVHVSRDCSAPLVQLKYRVMMSCGRAVESAGHSLNNDSAVLKYTRVIKAAARRQHAAALFCFHHDLQSALQL